MTSTADTVPDPTPRVLTREDARRRRTRNIAVFVALLGLVGLFYLVAVARIQAGLEQAAATRGAAEAAGHGTAGSVPTLPPAAATVTSPNTTPRAP